MAVDFYIPSGTSVQEAPTSSDLSVFTPSGTTRTAGLGGSTQFVAAGGVQARSATERAADILNLRDFAPSGNFNRGTDNTVAFNAAIQQVPSSGGVILVPNGTVLSGVTLDRPLTIRGEGPTADYGQATIYAATPTTTVFNVATAFSRIENLAFNPLSGKQTGGSYIQVQTAAARFFCDRLTMTEFYTGITLLGPTATVAINNFRAILYANGAGTSPAAIHVQGGFDVSVANFLIAGPGGDACAAGIWVENVADINMVGPGQIVNMGTDLLINPGNGQGVSSVWATKVFFDSAVRGLDITPTGTGLVQRCQFIGCWFANQRSTDAAIRITATGSGAGPGASVDGVEFIAPELYNNAGHGFLISGGKNIRILGGKIAYCAGDGVHVSAGVTDWSVLGTTIGVNGGFPGNGGYGVSVENGASDRYVIDPIFTGNTAGAVSDLGTGLNKKVSASLGDPNAYLDRRDGSTGFQVIRGLQSTYSGFDFETTDSGGTSHRVFRIQNDGGLGVVSVTVAALSASPAGTVKFANDGRNAGETAGHGTGLLVTMNTAGTWIAPWSGVAVTV